MKTGEEKLIGMFRLIGILLSVLIIAISVFYLIVDFPGWISYLGFLVFGFILGILFIREFRRNRLEVRVKRFLERIGKL